mmetsp:Transcript_96746/g.190035  ORF Transcript_96746/g.190035 Transcript_96746/m.190035 type:complete len:340 (+) Transcript_96746:109-1128(+)
MLTGGLPAGILGSTLTQSLQSAPALLAAGRNARSSALQALGRLRVLKLPEVSVVSHEFAETLGNIVVQVKAHDPECSLQHIDVNGLEFSLGDVCIGRVFNADVTAAQAAVLCPLLRANRDLHWVRCTETFQGVLWLDVRRLRAVHRGSVVAWNEIWCLAPDENRRQACRAFVAQSLVELVLVLGLIEVADPPRRLRHILETAASRWVPWPWGCFHEAPRRIDRADGVLLAMHSYTILGRTDTHGRRALSVASARCACSVKIFDNMAFAHHAVSDRITTWAFLAFIVLVLTLRVCENSYAVEAGYPGALLAQHPLRVYTFAERRAFADMAHSLLRHPGES